MVLLIQSRYKLTFLLSFFLISCGLPTQIVLNTPAIVSDQSDYTVGFRTLNNSFVNGYVLYYKIYAQGADDDLIISDKEDIEENLSLTGNTILVNHGFQPAYRYYEDQVVERDLLERYNGSNDTIVLDFTPPQELRIFSNETVLSDVNGEYILARVQDRPGEDKGKKSFTDSYDSVDEDLKVLYERLGGESLSIAKIGFAVYAIGSDPSIGFTEIQSLPVFLGTVLYSSTRTN